MHPTSTHKRPRPVSPRPIQIPSSQQQHSSDSVPASAPPGGQGAASSAFRNVSACNRCRLRKNRCDQNLPACTSCEKANVKCVGFDPITKREIPRAYVYYLESRVSYLEETLKSRGVAFASADDFDLGTEKRVPEDESPVSPHSDKRPAQSQNHASKEEKKTDDVASLNKLVSNIGMVSVQGASDPRYLGSTSGISFARVVFAAVRNSVSGSTSERAGLRPGMPLGNGGAPGAAGANFRDSFFGLQCKPAFKQAPFPDRDLGARLANLYFENANPQIPILHRGEFMALFDRTYATEERKRGPRELYMLFIVFAIGAGIILGEPATDDFDDEVKQEQDSPKFKKPKLESKQYQPEEYHASAMKYLEYFLGSSPAADRPEGFGGSLEELQAVLLLAGFALLRPVAPGLWYICGVAMRLGVDLGLHYEDGTGIEDSMGGTGVAQSQEVALEAAGVRPNAFDAKEKGRREWVRDLRRRIWWCVYSFDRLVSTCVGRPFGITDQVITTEFPSILDDNFITTSGFTGHPGAENDPSYKRVAHHYFRLRLLQSEILQVLQYRQAQQARIKGRNSSNEYMHTKLRSPFLDRHENFHSWRQNIDRRLFEWKEGAPRQKDTTVSFSVQFLELNYWQAVIMLYRQSLTVPQELEGEVSPSSEIGSPMEKYNEEAEEDDDVFLKVAEAGQNVLKIYYQLHKAHVVNYTFLATHHLFMAGIAFLYAIWHSATVRTLLTLDDVDYTVLAGTTVLRNLTEKCPPAEACRDAFDRMAKATIHMCLSTSGFGTRAPAFGGSKSTQLTTPHQSLSVPSRSSLSPQQQFQQAPQPQQAYFHQAVDQQGRFRPQRPRPQFDMHLRDLFPEETPEAHSFRHVGRVQPPQQSHTQAQSHSCSTSQMTTTPSVSSQLQYARSSASPIPQYSPHATDTFSIPGTPPQGISSNYNPNPSYSMSNPSVSSSNGFPTSNPTHQQQQHQQQQQQLLQSQQHQNAAFDPNDPLWTARGTNDLDALLADSTAAYTGHAGLSLGFDTDHDWNDGWGPDLFEGFWFGGWGGGGGVGGMQYAGIDGSGMEMDGEEKQV